MSPLLTPLQLHTWASSASSAAPASSLGPPRSNSNSTRSCGSGSPLSKACVRNPTLRVSPSTVAPMTLSSRTMTDLYTPRRGSENTTCSSSSRSGAFRPIAVTSTPATLSFVAVRVPW